MMMRIQEVCKHLNVTRKAVEYYIEQALLRPSVLENGYRDFSQEDVEGRRLPISLGLFEI